MTPGQFASAAHASWHIRCHHQLVDIAIWRDVPLAEFRESESFALRVKAEVLIGNAASLGGRTAPATDHPEEAHRAVSKGQPNWAAPGLGSQAKAEGRN